MPETVLNASPLISVLMTAYNRQEFIAEAIQSVIGSTYTNWELIIVDDVSADSTVDIALSYAEKNSRIQVHRNEKNLGDYANRNKAFGYSMCEYFMFCDSDDLLLPTGIQQCVDTMLAFPEADMGMRIYDGSVAPFFVPPGESIRAHFFKKPFLNTGPGGTILKRSFFSKINHYPEKYGPANDLYFNLKAACAGGIVLLPFEFLYYRRHNGQEINNRFSYLYNNYNYLNDALDELPLPVSKEQLDWIEAKNKRRFLVNIITYFFSTWNVGKTLSALRKTKFGFRDTLKAVFH
jgi:glycosyltransferase involved in cell wall biosynthesis